jgi:hypothetical protein
MWLDEPEYLVSVNPQNSDWWALDTASTAPTAKLPDMDGGSRDLQNADSCVADAAIRAASTASSHLFVPVEFHSLDGRRIDRKSRTASRLLVAAAFATL